MINRPIMRWLNHFFCFFCEREHSKATQRGSCIALLFLVFYLGQSRAWADSSESGGTNTTVRFTFQRGTNALGQVDVELFDGEKPETVRNFLLYVRSGAYSNSFLHRCVPGFIVQGGGFSVTNPLSSEIFSAYRETTNYGRLTNEFMVGSRFSNTVGTLAMAKVANDPNSATSQWFFNLNDNSTNLDTQNGGFTVFGAVRPSTNLNEGTNVLTHFNTLSTNAGLVNLGKLLGSSYQEFSSLPVSYTNTVTRVPQNRELYRVQIAILNATNQVGQAAPAISLLAPPPYSRFTNQAVTIRGAATDDLEVARVVYRVQSGSLEIATGTTNWEFTFLPQPGFTTVTVESIDWDGARSPSESMTIYYEGAMPLDLKVQGSGAVTGLSNGQILRAGAFYTATATPTGNYVFEGWTGSVTSATPTITFQVPLNATNFNLTAKFIPDPVTQLTGTYYGLFQSLGSPNLDGAGFMTLDLQADGLCSGTILYHTVTYFYTARFDGEGNATLSGPLDGVNRYISLQLQRANAAGLITGTLSGTSTTTLVQLERLAPTLGTGNVPPVGRYTFVIPAISVNPPHFLTPGGNGFGTGTLVQGGALSLSGVLGDGTSFSATPQLTRLGRWPLYVTLAQGKGVLQGWLSYPTNQPGNLSGSLQWMRSADATAGNYPGGFSNQISFAASPYASPLAGARALNWANGLARLSGADLVPSLTNVVKLSTNNALEVMTPNSGLLQLNLDVLSGSVNGSFVDPWFGTTNTIRGTALQGGNTIRGQYVNGSQVGMLNVDVTPFLVTQAVSSVTLSGLTAALSTGGWLQFQGDGVIVLTNALKPQFDTLLDANGHSVVISGGGVTRLIEVRTNLAFSALGITFADGFYSGLDGTNDTPPEPGGDGLGAGILNLGGSVGLTNCLVTNCMVLGGDAGVDPSANGTNGAGGRALGAAICNRGGTVNLKGCVIADSAAVAGRGGVLSATGLVANAAGSALGAGLFSDSGECRILDSTFLRNRVRGGEPLLLPSGAYGRAGDAAGGAVAINGGTLLFTRSRCLTNTAAGAILATNTAGSGHSWGGAIFLETNVLARIEESTFSANSAIAGQFDQSDEAAESQGGAVFNAGALNLSRSTFEQNRALGGLSRPAGPALGGALASIGSLVVNSSMFNDNLARGGEYSGTTTNAVIGAEASGGAIYARNGTVAITNSTFAFNRAQGGSGTQLPAGTNAARGDGRGGALAMASNSVALVNLTLASNEASPGTAGDPNTGAGLGGGLANLNGIVKLRSSIVDSNAPGNLFGAVTDLGYNFSSDASFALTGAGSLTNAVLFLGPLTTNGGPTRTMAILISSPAHDAIRGDFPTVDQRGTARPQGSYADSGAFEFVQTLPIFSVQPSGTNVLRVGSSFALQALASGPGPISYYWMKDESKIASATNTTLTITNMQVSDAGNYTAVATNSFGSVTSTVATLVVDLKPFILIQPGDVLIAPGGSTSLVVSASGPALGFSWLHNNVLLPDAASTTLPIIAAGPGTQGSYQVIVTNYAGAVTSRLATVTFTAAALSILIPPQNATVAEGSASELRVLTSGIMPIGYQWRRDNDPIPDATNSILTFADTRRTNAGTYRVEVTNAYLTLTSIPAVLTVVGQPRLSIAAQGTNILVTCFGDPGLVHRLFNAANLDPGSIWVAIATNSIPGSGSIIWTRPAPTDGRSVYFRAVTP